MGQSYIPPFHKLEGKTIVQVRFHVKENRVTLETSEGEIFSIPLNGFIHE